MNVAFFAGGSSVKFQKNHHQRANGTSEYYKTILVLLKNKNVKNITLIGKSDWFRLPKKERSEIDPEGKIIDPYCLIPELHQRSIDLNNIDHRRWYYQRYYELFEKNLEFPDFGIGFMAQGWATNSIPGFLYSLKPSKETGEHYLVRCYDMTLFYASEVSYFLSKSNIKWWLIGTDPRYVKPSMRNRDVSNIPQKILGQQDFDIQWYSIKKLDRKSMVNNGGYCIRNIRSEYSGVEKMNLIGENIQDPSNKRDYKFTIVSMQVSSPGISVKSDFRFNILKEWILDRDEDQSTRIFGKWADKFKEGYPQFKGYIDTEDLDNTFLNTRYTLVLPTKDGWVTSKYAEMLQLGVVPFLHPRYDSQRHIVPEDHPIRVKDPEDFYKKMDYYDNNPNERIKLVKDLQKDLIWDANSGMFLVKAFNNALKETDLTNFRFDDSNESFVDLIKDEKVKSNKLF